VCFVDFVDFFDFLTFLSVQFFIESEKWSGHIAAGVCELLASYEVLGIWQAE
jgi:hypothetical protein